MIEGVVVTPLKRISHEKGDILHAMKSSETSFTSFGEAYFSTVNHKDIKGWKKHTRMVLNLVVPVGAIKFVIYDTRPESKSCENNFEIIISSNNYCRLTVPPDVWMAFQGVGTDLNLLLNLASIEHDPKESEVCDIFAFKYDWDVADQLLSERV